MRARLSRRLAAVAVAASIGAGLTVQPAYAEVPATPIVNLGFAALKLFKGPAAGADLAKAVVELIRAVTAAKDQVLVHLDAHAAARAVGEAEALSIEMLSYNTIASDEDVLAIFVMDALRSASLDKAELNATTDPRSADQIGQALNVAYLYVMSTIRDAGYSTASVRTALQAYIAANETILQRLAPSCSSTVQPSTSDWLVITRHTCAGADGTTLERSDMRNIVTGQWITPKVDVEQLRLEAGANSSWNTARVLLPDLRAELAGL
ncbi:MAG TPA: hypothetical protein VMU51_14740 [Mycobacteriales bacterium]|nr:hypothetical protein [Mycobacteriales bacterium]